MPKQAKTCDFSDTWLAPGNSFIHGDTDQYEICLIDDPDGDGAGDIVCGRLFDLPAEPPERYEEISVDVVADSLKCGLDTDGAISCWESWGDSLNDQSDALPSGDFVSIHGAGYSGWQHLCGLTESGDTECVGAGTIFERAMKYCPLPTSGIIDISYGGTVGYLTDDGMVSGWNSSFPDTEDSCLMEARPDAFDVEMANNTLCIRNPGGSIECEQINSEWEEDLSVGVPTGAYTQISSFGALGEFACALAANDEITCWGNDWLGKSTFDFKD